MLWLMGETSLITLLKIMQQRAKHKEIATGVGYNYITGCLLDYPYFIENIYQRQEIQVSYKFLMLIQKWYNKNVLLDILNIIQKHLFLKE